MSPKKNKTPCKPKVKSTATIPLPQIKRAGKYFQDLWKKLKPNGATLSVQNSRLLITTENEEILANIRATIEIEMKKFIESNRSLTKILPQMKYSRITKGRRKHKELIPHGVLRTTRVQDCQHSKHVNLFLRKKRQQWNRIKMMWKQWYINRRKFNAKFKAINKYFGTLIRQRHREVSFYEQEKRSKIEYYQQKILGRKRDRLKEKRVYRPKRRKTKNASKYNLTLNEHSRSESEMSKLKFITTDAAKTMMFHLKNKKESHLTMISGGSLGGAYGFPLFPWVDMILIDKNKFVIRYYNQQIFIYRASFGTNRPLKRNLVHTFSTLSGKEIKFDQRTEHNRSTSTKKPTLVTQKNKSFSETNKPEATRKDTSQMFANHHVLAPVRVKSKQSS
jgi:hypothetical protein